MKHTSIEVNLVSSLPAYPSVIISLILVQMLRNHKKPDKSKSIKTNCIQDRGESEPYQHDQLHLGWKVRQIDYFLAKAVDLLENQVIQLLVDT